MCSTHGMSAGGRPLEEGHATVESRGSYLSTQKIVNCQLLQGMCSTHGMNGCSDCTGKHDQPWRTCPDPLGTYAKLCLGERGPCVTTLYYQYITTQERIFSQKCIPRWLCQALPGRAGPLRHYSLLPIYYYSRVRHFSKVHTSLPMPSFAWAGGRPAAQPCTGVHQLSRKSRPAKARPPGPAHVPQRSAAQRSGPAAQRSTPSF